MQMVLLKFCIQLLYVVHKMKVINLIQLKVRIMVRNQMGGGSRLAILTVLLFGASYDRRLLRNVLRNFFLRDFLLSF